MRPSERGHFDSWPRYGIFVWRQWQHCSCAEWAHARPHNECCAVLESSVANETMLFANAILFNVISAFYMGKPDLFLIWLLGKMYTKMAWCFFFLFGQFQFRFDLTLFEFEYCVLAGWTIWLLCFFFLFDRSCMNVYTSICIGLKEPSMSFGFCYRIKFMQSMFLFLSARLI